MIIFPFKCGALEPFSAPMGKGKGEKSVSIEDLRAASINLKAWRTGALVRLARKQTERVMRRTHPVTSNKR